MYAAPAINSLLLDQQLSALSALSLVAYLARIFFRCLLKTFPEGSLLCKGFFAQ